MSRKVFTIYVYIYTHNKRFCHGIILFGTFVYWFGVFECVGERCCVYSCGCGTNTFRHNSYVQRTRRCWLRLVHHGKQRKSDAQKNAKEWDVRDYIVYIVDVPGIGQGGYFKMRGKCIEKNI